MRFADFSPPIQFILIGLVAVASAVLLIRAMVFFHHRRIGVRPTYPSIWSAAQCRALERFRLLVGLGLIPLWGSFLFIAQWPFEFWDLFYFILLLLISSAWVRLLDQRKWEKSGTNSREFWKTITFLMVWWGVVFTATEWMFAPSILSKLSDRTSAQTPLAGSSNSLLVGKAAYSDWRADAPGIRRHIRPSDLPAPYASSSAVNGVSVVGKPADSRLNVPLGFTVKLLASLTRPRLIRVAPNGDIFIAESEAGRIRVLRPSGGGDEVIRNEIFVSGLRMPEPLRRGLSLFVLDLALYFVAWYWVALAVGHWGQLDA